MSDAAWLLIIIPILIIIASWEFYKFFLPPIRDSYRKWVQIRTFKRFLKQKGMTKQDLITHFEDWKRKGN